MLSNLTKLILTCAVAVMATCSIAIAQTRGSGACCFPDGSCAEFQAMENCMYAGGQWQGDGMFCAPKLQSGNGGVICQPFAPMNDDCVDAMPIGSLGMTVFGTTYNATSDSVPMCIEVEALNGGIFSGVWYSVIGTGSVMQAYLCGIDPFRGSQQAVIMVYCGGCDDLNCVASNVITLGPCKGRDDSAVRWCSELGREYLIFVAEGDIFPRETAIDFLLEVRATDQACDPEPCGPPANDDCEDAIMLYTSNSPMHGSVQNATVDEVDFCYVDRNGGPLGVWYKVIGTGTELGIDICWNGNGKGARGDVGAAVSVYCGSCDNLQCVAGGIDEIPLCNGKCNATAEQARTDSLVQWCTEEGREYFVLVEIFEADNFEITLFDTGNDECEPEPCSIQAQDFCEDAQAVCPGIDYVGNTFDATSAYIDHGGPFETIFFCGFLFGIYDVWYQYTPAEDGLLFVHVEGPPTEFVYGIYDDCDELTGNLLACNTAIHYGVIVYPVIAYETYYIRIAGRGFTRGEFHMELIAPPCVGDLEDMQNISE